MDKHMIWGIWRGLTIAFLIISIGILIFSGTINKDPTLADVGMFGILFAIVNIFSYSILKPHR